MFISDLRPRNGASNKLLQLLMAEDPRLKLCLSQPVVLEYEEVAKRPAKVPYSSAEVDEILDALCAIADLRAIYYLWRPWLFDPDDEALLEVAFESGATYIVTNNKRHLQPAHSLGIQIVSAAELLRLIGELK